MEIEREYVGGELGAFLQLEVYHGDPWRALVPHGMKNTARCAQKCCRWTLEKKLAELKVYKHEIRRFPDYE